MSFHDLYFVTLISLMVHDDRYSYLLGTNPVFDPGHLHIYTRVAEFLLFFRPTQLAPGKPGPKAKLVLCSSDF